MSTAIPASPEAIREYWNEFAKIGPRHAALARWVYHLRWNVSAKFANGWLAPELEGRVVH